MSGTLTRGVRIIVTPQYIPERSSADHSYYFFAYHVTIRNEGEVPVQLISRHWIITDGTGRVQEVRGPGVVGEQPRLQPGEEFEYTSACPLPTEVGSMHGTYQMVTDSDEHFDACIEPFTLARPNIMN